MNVNKKSWHYKWYTFTKVTSSIIGNNFHAIKRRRARGQSWVEIHDGMFFAPTNFCQYWRAVLVYPLVALLVNLSIFSLIVAGLAMNPMVMLYGILGVLGLIGILFVIATLAVGSEYVSNKTKEIVRSEDNLIGNIYKSYKNNICTKVNYED